MPLRHDIRRGALMMLAATALFTVMSAIIKGVSSEIHFIEIMFFRSAFALPVMIAMAARGRNWAALRTKRPGGHVLRAFTGTMAQGCSFFALTVLPLAEQTALTYTTPLFVTILSIPFLGEKVGIHRWSAVLFGFGGIMVIALGDGAFQAGAMPTGIVAVGMAVAVIQGAWSAITTLLVRSLSATESSTTIVLWQSLLMTLFTLVALPFIWTTPSLWEFILLVLVGLIGGVAQVLLTEAYASAQVSALGPYSYTSILWSVAIGWVVFSDVPSWSTVAGAAVIVASGLYILHRELKRAAMRRNQ
ncbi:DMT family transporter [Roseomonas terrae]|jgi:drug/metabolite transporter (DMT)-like permease|uniref:DMT family transporter n=1 Tax=Neoroseomonas terrae TaxID=424799 RepID=A0ABS5ED41_9PROT|nr:DMT family transporter [Neoroseomonas terrae]MBR0648940.1 DMT family transporter [Neoroseomonas terrae]